MIYEKNDFSKNFIEERINTYYRSQLSTYQFKVDIIFISLLVLEYLYGISVSYISFKNVNFLIINLVLLIFCVTSFIVMLKCEIVFKKLLLKYIMIICLYISCLYEIIHIEKDFEVLNIILLIKAFDRLILISSISICLLIEINILSMIIFGSINTIILLLAQLLYSKSSLIEEIVLNILIFAILGYTRNLNDTLFKSNFVDKIKNNFMNSHSMSMLNELKCGFVSLYDKEIYFSNNDFIKLINKVCPSLDDGVANINGFHETEEVLIRINSDQNKSKIFFNFFRR